MTVWSRRPERYRTSATRSELVTTVTPGISATRAASAWVVVPAEIAIAMPGSTSAAAAAAIACFSSCWSADLATNPGSIGREARDQRRAAVDLLEEAVLVEDLEVAPDRHVGDPEVSRKVGDPDGARLADPIEDHRLALTGEHRLRSHSAHRMSSSIQRRPRRRCSGATAILNSIGWQVNEVAQERACDCE